MPPQQIRQLLLSILLLSTLLSGTISAAEIVTLDVVDSTPDLPRHDHQLIFPLKDGKLLLVWSEYYRTPETSPGPQRDNMPCRIAAMESSDQGRTWTERRVLQPNIGKYNVKHPNLTRLPDGEVLLFFTAWNSMQDRTVYMRRSSDDCQTWSEPIKVSTLPGINNINNDHVSIL
ncbi:MAG: exo-alpha-sialidase, partial [Planctomycetaceae bacterium]|nr:exo-alpha-sialidase [Planctomycetaceae bacterium]